MPREKIHLPRAWYSERRVHRAAGAGAHPIVNVHHRFVLACVLRRTPHDCVQQAHRKSVFWYILRGRITSPSLGLWIVWPSVSLSGCVWSPSAQSGRHLLRCDPKWGRRRGNRKASICAVLARSTSPPPRFMLCFVHCAG